jgi:16S rRNA (guanine(966)-N(2))-methyltransferase RsmD
MLKIHSGLYKGRKLKSPKTELVRPTTARLKLSFFDIAQEKIRESIFLDGFCGCGNIGIEALSRGAGYVVFNDQLGESIKLLNHNLEKIQIPQDYYRVIKGEFNRTVIGLSKNDLKFDVIFLDPPYDLLNYANPLKVIFKRGILKDDGMIVLERPTRINFKAKYFERFKSRTLGREVIDFYRYPKDSIGIKQFP